MATVVSRTNSNFEKVGKIQVLSSSKTNPDELSGKIFGGYGYDASVQVNDGNGYSITIKVISKDGKYTITSKDLNATKIGSKNITVGTFTFFNFFLISYSIEKEAESSILILTYKDKSIFMDKLYIGLLNFDYGVDLLKNPNGSLNINIPPGVTNYAQSANFTYTCPNNNTSLASITRILGTTITENHKIKAVDEGKKVEYLKSKYFYSNYNYEKNSVNGGYIIVGSEELQEQPCTLPDVTYSIKDLLSALYYSDVPGLADLNLGDNKIFSQLRRKYYGPLRSVLDEWGNDFGFKFYFQPKISFRVKDYKNIDQPSNLFTIQEGLKYIDLKSTEQTLNNLNKLFDPSAKEYSEALQKVIESVSETATLEGTIKQSVITPIRREARTFDANSQSTTINYAPPVSLSAIPSVFGVDPNSSDFKIRGTLAIYDSDFRDVHAITTGQFSAVGMTLISNLGASKRIQDNFDFFSFFGSELLSSSAQISDFVNKNVILLVRYNQSQHEFIKNWEKSVMESFYNQYYSPLVKNDQVFCSSYNIFNINYVTEPSSQRYSYNELPFKDLLFGNSSLTNDVTNKKSNPLFQVQNPFFEGNQALFSTYSSRIGADFSSKKTISIINLSQNSTARSAFFLSLNAGGVSDYDSYKNDSNVCVVVCPRFSNLNISNIELKLGIANSSVLTIDQLKVETDVAGGNCSTTSCNQTLVDYNCTGASQENNVSKIVTGFVNNLAEYIKIDYSYQVGAAVLTDTFNLILPSYSNYQCAISKSVSSSIVYPSASLVFGKPPSFESTDSNVLSFGSIKNEVPEVLTQSVKDQGVQSFIISFDDAKKPGERVVVSDIFTYHDLASQQLNTSVLNPQQTRKLSLTSTYVPVQLKDYIFNNPVLNSMSFTLNNDGFNMSFDFQSRPKQVKARDSIFLTEQFLRRL